VNFQLLLKQRFSFSVWLHDRNLNDQKVEVRNKSLSHVLLNVEEGHHTVYIRNMIEESNGTWKTLLRVGCLLVSSFALHYRAGHLLFFYCFFFCLKKNQTYSQRYSTVKLSKLRFYLVVEREYQNWKSKNRN